MTFDDQEFSRRIKKTLETLDEEYRWLHGRLLEYQGIGDVATIPCRCDQFDAFLADAVFRMRQVWAVRSIFLQMIARLSEIEQIKGSASRQSALLLFSISYSDEFRVWTTYRDQVGDADIVNSAYRYAIRAYEGAIMSQRLKDEIVEQKRSREFGDD